MLLLPLQHRLLPLLLIEQLMSIRCFAARFALCLIFDLACTAWQVAAMAVPSYDGNLDVSEGRVTRYSVVSPQGLES